jgi:FkbM family methyltransferase
MPESSYFAINGTETIKLTEGRKLIFHANPTSNLLRVLFWKGIEGFEYAPYKVFVELAKRSHLCFDIGANIGYYAIVAKLFNPKIKVHGFEPLPSANKYFKINAELNKVGDIQIHQTALTNFNGIAKFYSNLNPRFPNEKDHLYGDNSLNTEATGNIAKIEFDVVTQTLDDFVSKNLKENEKIDLIKIDTEGTENLVFEGGKNVLQFHRPVIMCEVIKGFIEKELEVILGKFNYAFYEVRNNGLVKVDSLNVQSGKIDFFFVPEEKQEMINALMKS